MKAVRVMVHDWAFWCYMVLAVVTICFVAMLAHRNNRQYSSMMEAHENNQKTMDAIISRNQSADRAQQKIERELRILESQQPARDVEKLRGDGATSE
jgi:Fic family protein